MSLDEVAAYNRARWNELVAAGVAYSRPVAELNPDSAAAMVDGSHLIRSVVGDFYNLDVLCLAAGGGQQSVAFAILGANVTVFDLSDAQLDRDREAAALHGLQLTAIQGDMRDLSHFAADSFDIVYHAYSINFVPDIKPVFAEVSRVLRPRGVYRLAWHNPYTQLVDDLSWNGQGYLMVHPYREGNETTGVFPFWEVEAEDGSVRRVDSPRAFVHSLGRMVNELVQQGFVVYHALDMANQTAAIGPEPEPGSWAHYTSVVAPYIDLWTVLLPDLTRELLAGDVSGDLS